MAIPHERFDDYSCKFCKFYQVDGYSGCSIKGDHIFDNECIAYQYDDKAAEATEDEIYDEAKIAQVLRR